MFPLVQFRTFGITAECLFALINGDDMFATFMEMPQNNKLIYYFSQFYLYTFISLFIFVVLSLFIAIIEDTYNAVKVSTRFRVEKSNAYFFPGAIKLFNCYLYKGEGVRNMYS